MTVELVSKDQPVKQNGGCWWLRGAGNAGYCFMGTEFRFGKMKKVLEMGGSDDCMTL